MDPTGGAPGVGRGLKTAPDITIDGRGRWFFGADLIVNEGVLAYFKANLHRDDKGYYILNRFGKLVEQAYLKSVTGFPILALNFRLYAGDESSGKLMFQTDLDAGRAITEDADALFLVDEATVGFIARDSRIPVRLAPAAMIALADRLRGDVDAGLQLAFPGASSVTLKRRTMAELFP